MSEGKGWFKEYPEHALTAKGISLGREKKKKISTTVARPEIEVPPLEQALSLPITSDKAQIIIPEQKIEIPPEHVDKVVGIAVGAQEKEEADGLNVFGINLKDPETAFTDFFGGLGEAWIMGTEQTGEGLVSPFFMSDKEQKDLIAGETHLGKKGETFNVAEEAFGEKALDESFEDMAKTKVEINYLETPEDELEAEALAQEERQRAGISPAYRVGETAGEAVGGAIGYVGKEALAGATYLEKKIAEKAKAGVEKLKEKFRKDTGREPTQTEEDKMAEDIASQVEIKEEEVPEAPKTPEEAQPTIAEPQTPPMPITPEGYIPEEQAREIVEDLRRQEIIKNNKGK